MIQLHFNDFALSFLSLLFEGIPFLLFGTLISGLIDAFVPSSLIQRLVPRNRYLAVASGGLLGLIFPMCECGIVPVLRRLIQKGVPVPAAVTYMLAAPIVNPLVALSTFVAFKGQDALAMTSARLALGYGVAVLVGWSLVRTPVTHIISSNQVAPVRESPWAGGWRTNTKSSSSGSGSFSQKLRSALHCATADFIDVAIYLVIGSAIAAVFNTGLDRAVIESWASSPASAIRLMMLAAILLCLCSTSDAFIAATLTSFPAASKLSFMVLGPMFDLKLLFLYLAVFEKKFVARLGFTLVILIGILSLAAHYVRWP